MGFWYLVDVDIASIKECALRYNDPTVYTTLLTLTMKGTSVVLLVGASFFATASAQYFKRLGGCPTLGCVFPPDQTDFLAGQYFDIRLEVHAPVNGTEAHNGGVPDEKFTFCIQQGKGSCKDATKFFSVAEPKIETWSFS